MKMGGLPEPPRNPGRFTLHAQTYGETVDAMTLIPHMLEAFMAKDRGFRGSKGEGGGVRPAPRSGNGAEGQSGDLEEPSLP